jgi:DNA polymerase-3 subunit epsilon
MSRVIFGGLDFETTGLDVHRGHRLIELALTLHDEDGKRLGSYETRLNPGRGIDPDAQKIHGIAFEDLLGQPTWETVAPKFSALLGKCSYVVAHNGEGFDLPFVAYELMRVGAPVPAVYSIDTMLQGRWATPDGAVPNLGALCFAMGVPYDTGKAHGAGYDVAVLMDCFFKGLKRGLFTLPTGPWTCPPPPKAKGA